MGGEGGVARVGIFNLVFHILGATRSLVCAERVAGGTGPRVAAGGFLPLPGTATALLVLASELPILTFHKQQLSPSRF